VPNPTPPDKPGGTSAAPPAPSPTPPNKAGATAPPSPPLANNNIRFRVNDDIYANPAKYSEPSSSSSSSPNLPEPSSDESSSETATRRPMQALMAVDVNLSSMRAGIRRHCRLRAVIDTAATSSFLTADGYASLLKKGIRFAEAPPMHITSATGTVPSPSSELRDAASISVQASSGERIALAHRRLPAAHAVSVADAEMIIGLDVLAQAHLSLEIHPARRLLRIAGHDVKGAPLHQTTPYITLLSCTTAHSPEFYAAINDIGFEFVSSSRAARKLTGSRGATVLAVHASLSGVPQPNLDAGSNATRPTINPELDADQRLQLERLVDEYNAIFSEEQPPLPPHRPGYDIRLSLRDPQAKFKRYKVNFSAAELEALELILRELLGAGILKPGASPFACPAFLVKKPKGGWRLVTDLRAVNAIIHHYPSALPPVEESLANLQRATFISTLDLHGGFNQLRIEEGSQHLASLFTPLGSFIYTTAPMGLQASTAFFHRFINDVIRGKLELGAAGEPHDLTTLGAHNFVDDLQLGSLSFDDHFDLLRRLFARLKANRIYLRPSKCFLGFSVPPTR
jgi:hypothetical protein